MRGSGSGRAPRARVLIVDDEPDILLMLRVNLEAEGYETLLAGDGDTAVRRIRDERPDVVLLDVMMPVLDGWGVLERLAAAQPRPKVIVLTAKSGDRDHSRAWELGADGYLTKPFDPDELIARVDDLLRQRGTGRRDGIEAVFSSDVNRYAYGETAATTSDDVAPAAPETTPETTPTTTPDDPFGEFA